MICTFGDTTDVIWWRELGLPVRSIVGRDGRIVQNPPPGVTANGAWYARSPARSVKQAQTRIVEMLTESGDMVGEPKPITHPVKFWENGNRPLEIVTSRQWFIRYPPTDDLLGARTRAALVPRLHAGPLRELGQRPRRRLEHHPPALLRRALPGLVPGARRRQRRPLPPDPAGRRRGCPSIRRPTLPTGYDESQRDKPGGFVGDPDVMDTWATSSLTPQIVSGWVDDPDLFERVFPMDLRPQAHEIIRTWLFYTVVRAQIMHGASPLARRRDLRVRARP